jgi:peptidoglycan/xylan/chitin deacetylase (PgdA/CDA1 family)
MMRVLKQLLAAACYRSGLLGLWWRTHRRPLVVMYHRVLESTAGCDHSQRGIVVSTTSFDRQLRFLARYFDLVPLRTLVPATVAAAAEPAASTTARPPDGGKPPCAVTFDDGWADNHRCAWPALRALEVPATIFMAAGYIGTRSLFWPERLSFLLATPARTRIRRELLDGMARPVVEAVLRVAQASDGALADAIDDLIETIKELDEDARESLLEVLSGATGRNAATLGPRMLDWDAVRELAANGIEIGSHGVSHAILTRVDQTRAVAEIRTSRERLAAEVGTAPTSFAYPNGDWSPAIVEAVRAAGYERAVATEPPARDTHRGDEHYPFAVPRKNLAEGSSSGWRGYSESVFACEVLGFFDALRNLGGWR